MRQKCELGLRQPWELKIRQINRALTIEFKYNQSAEEALKQIKEKEYFSRYQNGDYPNDVLLIGINYNRKTKDHQCIIEEMDLS